MELKLLSEESNYESFKKQVATNIDTINRQLDKGELEISTNTEIETDFSQKQVRKVKKQPDDQTSYKNLQIIGIE